MKARLLKRMAEACCPSAPMTVWDEEKATRVASILRALGDEVRLKILALLAHHGGEVCVCDIVANFPLGQPTISYHLKVLREAGLVESQKRGLWVHYSLHQETIASMWKALEGML